MPLVQEAPRKRDWLKVASVLTISIVLVTTLFGAVLGAPATALAGIVGSKRTMGLIMQSTLVITGLVMLVIALGELGLTRRLLPEIHFDPRRSEGASAPGSRGMYRQAAILGATMAATFGIACTKPLYLALLAYVALIGNIAYGALALGAYGLGMASSVALAGFVLLFLPAGRFGRLLRWLEDRQEAFHIVQGVVFAAAGGLSVAFFLVRYGAFIPPM
jgi:cytochrome c biogenesis protein CcdA